MILKPGQKYLYALTFCYFAMGLIGVLHHELWLDEAHHWLLARDSSSVAELFANTRTEGHPLLWTLMLYGISRFTSDPFWMQFLHILIATSAVFLFLHKAPFSWVFKTLFIFGYFMIYEYSLISRNYALGILFLFLACSVFRSRQQKFISLCVFLALAANTHLMFSVIAFALFLTLLLENAINHRFFKREFIIGYGIFILGLVSIIVQILYTDSDWLLDRINQLPLQERLVKGAASLFKGLINIPDFRTIHFWNSNYIVNSFRTVAAVLVVLIYALPLVVFAKNRKTLFFVYTALIGTQIFFFVTQRAATRFQGMTFIIFIVALWIENNYKSENFKLKEILERFKLTPSKYAVVYAILLIQMFSGIYAYAMDYQYPFTSAKETVDFFRKQKLEDREIVTVTCDGTLISAYLQRKIWFLCDGDYESFCHWDSGCAGNVTPQKTLEMLGDFMKTHSDAIFVSNYPFAQAHKDGRWMWLNADVKFRFLKKFDVNMVDRTDYYIFEVSKK